MKTALHTLSGLICTGFVCGSFAAPSWAGSADPAGARMWIAHADQDIISLAYGLPESDDVPLSFVCDRATKTVTVSVQLEPVRNPDPETLPIEISAGESRLALTAQGSRLEIDDSFMLSASTPATPELAKLFAGGKLSILAEQKTTEFPIDDVARKGGEEIVEGCGG